MGKPGALQETSPIWRNAGGLLKPLTHFDKWLVRERKYCELCSGPFPATQIIHVDNKQKVVCDAHARAYSAIETQLYKLALKKGKDERIR
jgi:hypothetical protein